MKRIVLLSAALSLVALASANAQTAAQRAACGADVKKFCPGMRPGGGQILDCLAKQKPKLSPACRKVVEQQGR
jgi:hypothetical protein